MQYKNILLHNIAEIVPAPEGRGWLPSRVPSDVRAQLNERAQLMALQGTGCELRFNLEGESATVTLAMEERPAIVEVYHGPFLASWHVVDTTPTEIAITPPERLEMMVALALERNLPFDPRLVRVVLPWRPAVHMLDISGELSPPRAEQTPAQTYLAYGSSITHGNNSVGATGMYARRTAQHLGVDFLDLGFGGGAHCEAALAEYIATRGDWDFATLEMGINMVRWLAVEEFAARVDTFVSTIAEANPDKWLFCIDLFTFGGDFDAEFTRADEYRRIVRETVARLDMPKLVHLDGRDLLQDVSGLCIDLVHPAPAGMEEIARRLSATIADTLGG